MTQLFHSYEQEFIQALTSVSRKLEAVAIQPNIKKQLAFSDAKSQLTDCEKNIKYMQTEVSGFVQTVKSEFQVKIRKYKKQYDEMRRKLYRLEEEYIHQKNKDMLMGARLDEQQNANQKLIKDGQMLSDTTYKMKESVIKMRQTEEVSNGIQIELVSHTDRLKKNKQKMNVVNEDLSESQSLVRSITANIKKNKIVMWIVLGVVLLIIIIIVAVVVSKKHAAAAANNNVQTKL